MHSKGEKLIIKSENNNKLMPKKLYDYHIFVEHGKIPKFYKDG